MAFVFGESEYSVFGGESLTVVFSEPMEIAMYQNAQHPTAQKFVDQSQRLPPLVRVVRVVVVVRVYVRVVVLEVVVKEFGKTGYFCFP